MLATIPVSEMAETLRVLAGDNAANAAFHFTQHSYERGDVPMAELWAGIARAVVGGPPVPKRAAASAAAAGPSPADSAAVRRIRESIALQGVRYEDMDAETLALEEKPASVVRRVSEWRDDRPRPFGFARAGTPANAAHTPELELAEAA